MNLFIWPWLSKEILKVLLNILISTFRYFYLNPSQVSFLYFQSSHILLNGFIEFHCLNMLCISRHWNPITIRSLLIKLIWRIILTCNRWYLLVSRMILLLRRWISLITIWLWILTLRNLLPWHYLLTRNRLLWSLTYRYSSHLLLLIWSTLLLLNHLLLNLLRRQLLLLLLLTSILCLHHLSCSSISLLSIWHLLLVCCIRLWLLSSRWSTTWFIWRVSLQWLWIWYLNSISIFIIILRCWLRLLTWASILTPSFH